MASALRERGKADASQLPAPALAARLARRCNTARVEHPQTATGFEVAVVRGGAASAISRLPVSTGRARWVETAPKPLPVARRERVGRAHALDIIKVKTAMAARATLPLQA